MRVEPSYSQSMVWDSLQNLGIIAVGTGAAGLVVRFGIERFSEVVERGIDQFFDKEMARHRAELENEQVVFSRLHEVRASVIVELYTRFVTFERDMRALTTGRSSDPPSDECLQKTTASCNEFANYYTKNKIYFPASTCDAVESLQDEMNAVFVDFNGSQTCDGRPERRPDVENWRANWRGVTEDEVPELKSELENHFRALLGVDLDGGPLEDLDS